jgi:hypothetical protein
MKWIERPTWIGSATQQNSFNSVAQQQTLTSSKKPSSAKNCQLSQLRSCCAPSAGQDGPLLYPGPLCGGEMGPTGRAAGTDRTSVPFRQYTDVLSKSPAPAHELAAHGWAASAKRGGLLFWLLFSWPRKRKVTRLPQADESLCLVRRAGLDGRVTPRLARTLIRPFGPPSPGGRREKPVEASPLIRSSFAGNTRRANAPRSPGRAQAARPTRTTTGHRPPPLITEPQRHHAATAQIPRHRHPAEESACSIA